MPGKARSETVRLGEVAVYHCWNRCVRPKSRHPDSTQIRIEGQNPDTLILRRFGLTKKRRSVQKGTAPDLKVRGKS